MSKVAYLFSPVTKEYVGEYSCQESPLEPGVFLMPANSTDVKVPKAAEGQVAVWAGDEWLLKPDYRNKTVYSAQSGVIVINPNVDTYKDFWFALPADYAVITDVEERKILSLLYDVKVSNNKILLEPIPATKTDIAAKLAELDISCKTHIANHFGAADIQIYNLMLTLGEISLDETKAYANSVEMDKKWYFYKDKIQTAQTKVELAEIMFVWE